MDKDLRCGSKKHGVLILEKNAIETKCDSRFCGSQRGVVVLHRFSIESGALLETIRYKNPERK